MNINLIERFYHTADTHRTSCTPALVTYMRDDDNSIVVNETYTWKDYADMVIRFKNYLLDNKYTNTAIHAFNSPEWFISAFGTIASGNHVAGIYGTNSNASCIHVINTANCDVLVIDTYATLINNYHSVFNDLLVNEINIIVVEDINVLDHNFSILTKNISHEEISNLISLRSYIVNFNDVISTTSNRRDRYTIDIDVYDTASLIFTSGTTSDPKAVRLSHNNIITSIESVLTAFNMGEYLHNNSENAFNENTEIIVSYLPLSHIAGQLLDMYAHIYHGGQIHFALTDALKGSLKDTLAIVRPTCFLGVPRVWEKIMEGILKQAKPKYEGFTGKLLKGFTSTVKAINYSYKKRYDEGGIVSGTLSGLMYPAYGLTSNLTTVVKDALGFDRCRYFISGASPISQDVLKYFMSIEIPIHEIYGMSETAGLISVSDPFSAIDTVGGIPADCIDIKIDSDNGEIMVRGDNVFDSYYGLDVVVCDDEGYFRTGDSGEIVNDKLRITGRIKELIITAGGENIPPVLIESHIMDEIKKVSSDSIDVTLMVVGDNRKFLSMLVFDPVGCMMESVIDMSINTYNENKAISRSQKIQKYRIITEALTIDSGLITPTMKMKRAKIVEKYMNIIDDMY